MPSETDFCDAQRHREPLPAERWSPVVEMRLCGACYRKTYQEIRYLARAGTFTQEDLSKRFDISQGEVSRVVNGELYADVPTGNRERTLTDAIDRAYADLLVSIPMI